MTALTRPDASRAPGWAEMLAEFGAEVPHGSGLWNLPDAEQHDRSATGCRRFVRLLDFLADPGSAYLDLTVPSWYFWLTDAESDGDTDGDTGDLVGFLAFRHRLSPWLLEEGGHVGYSVRPSRRREGHASRALALAVARAPELGIERVLVTCDVDNVASAATIEACGGVLEDVRRGKRRYWIDASGGPVAQVGSPGR